MKLTEEAERRRGLGTATQLAIQPSADLRAWRRRRCRPPPSCAPVAVPRVPVVDASFGLYTLAGRVRGPCGAYGFIHDPSEHRIELRTEDTSETETIGL